MQISLGSTAPLAPRGTPERLQSRVTAPIQCANSKTKPAAYVDDERWQLQAGAFYGGWATHVIVGPFNGAPGTESS
jgi:hypothetical protein